MYRSFDLVGVEMLVGGIEDDAVYGLQRLEVKDEVACGVLCRRNHETTAKQ